MIGPTNRKNWLTFGGDPVPDTDYGSLFHFPHRCGIWEFRIFISISHSHRSIFTTLGAMTDADKVTNPQHVGSDPANNRIRIQINPEVRIRIPNQFWLRLWSWRRSALSEHSLVLTCSFNPLRLLYADPSHCNQSSVSLAFRAFFLVNSLLLVFHSNICFVRNSECVLQSISDAFFKSRYWPLFFFNFLAIYSLFVTVCGSSFRTHL